MENILKTKFGNATIDEKGYYRIAVKSHEDNMKLIELLRRIYECN